MVSWIDKNPNRSPYNPQYFPNMSADTQLRIPPRTELSNRGSFLWVLKYTAQQLIGTCSQIEKENMAKGNIGRNRVPI